MFNKCHIVDKDAVLQKDGDCGAQQWKLHWYIFCMINETTCLNYTTNCNSLNKLWEQSLWYLSLVCTVWHNLELTWFILDNLADVSVNADCVFSDRLTYTKELTHCCCRFSSQQMLDLQFIVILRYSWVDMYFTHTFVSRMSLMLALMSQIYCCWSAEIIKKLEILSSSEWWKSQFEHIILSWDTEPSHRWGYSLSSLFRCHIMFFKFWLMFLTALSLQVNIFSDLQLTSSLFLSKLKDQEKMNKKMKEWIDIKLSEIQRKNVCFVLCCWMIAQCITTTSLCCCLHLIAAISHTLSMLSALYHNLHLLLLCLKLMSLHVYSYITYSMTGKQDMTLKFDKNDVDSNNSVFINMTQVTWVISLKKVNIEQMNHMIKNWLKNNELNIINMKSNAEKATLRPLIKVLYNEFDDLFLNAESFFIKAVMKFVIQQKLLNLCCTANSNKCSQKDSELTTLFMSKEAIMKELFLTSTFNSVSVTVNIKNFSIQMHVLQNTTVEQSDWSSQLSVVTIRDVLSDPHLNNNNFITQMLFKL